jgi:hypothetical protein
MRHNRTWTHSRPVAVAAATFVAASLLLTACGSSDASTQPAEATPSETTQSEAAPALTQEEVARWTAGGADFVGREATVTGKVFNIDHDGDNHVYQINADPENYDGNTLVYFEGADPGINKNDYIRATGIVQKDMSYENAFGATMSAPLLAATQVEKSTYQDIVSPTIASIDPQLACVANGYTVTMNRVEFAENETRVYVSLVNNGAGRLRIYDHNAVIIQDGKQYNTQTNYQADYPSINNEVAVGASLDGVICFPAIEQHSFQLQLRGSSDNWEVDGFELSFSFDITM